MTDLPFRRTSDYDMIERLIQIQERQMAIAESQNQSGARRDETLVKVGDTLAELTQVVKGREALFQEIHEAVNELPEVTKSSASTVVVAISKLIGEERAAFSEQIRKLKWWLFAATFMGSLLGGSSRELIEALLKFHP